VHQHALACRAQCYFSISVWQSVNQILALHWNDYILLWSAMDITTFPMKLLMGRGLLTLVDMRNHNFRPTWKRLTMVVFNS